jgi:CheY-like chemotaxis protein
MPEQSPRLILVDDDHGHREIPEIMLRLAGYQVDSCPDAACALSRLREAPGGYQGLLIDVRMPEMDGLSVIRALRSQEATARLPILILSAQARPEDIAEGLAAGADRYLTKPYTRPQLLEAIAALLPPSA